MQRFQRFMMLGICGVKGSSSTSTPLIHVKIEKWAGFGRDFSMLPAGEKHLVLATHLIRNTNAEVISRLSSTGSQSFCICGYKWHEKCGYEAGWYMFHPIQAYSIGTPDLETICTRLSPSQNLDI